MKKFKKFLWGLGVMAVGTMSIAGATMAKGITLKDGVIADGVTIGSVEVGGMTEDEAKDAVNSYVDGIMDTTFTLSGAKGDIELSAKDMQISSDVDAAVEDAMGVGRTGNLIDRYKEVTDLKKETKAVSMHLGVNKEETAMLIYKKSDKLNIEAIDSTLKVEGKNISFVEGTSGQEVDVVKSVYAINDFLENEWSSDNSTIELVSNEVAPRGTADELKNVKDLLGEFSTNFASSSPSRAQNVRNACSKVDGSIIYPGEEFSVYKAISPITEANGYGIGHAYENGQVVESVGGGVCQVATTLYNAIIRAELDVTMRFNHSMMVAYVSPSDDAAIAGSYKDLRFKNNTDTPVYIQGVTGGGIITFRVYGLETRPSDRKVSFESETLSTKDADPTFNFSAANDLGYYNVDQSAHRGCVARLWKVVTVGGKQESREIFNNSKYQAVGKTITVGIKGATAEQVSAIKAAAKSGDEGKVKAAIAAAKAENKKKKEDDDDKKDEEDGDDDKKEETNSSLTGIRFDFLSESYMYFKNM